MANDSQNKSDIIIYQTEDGHTRIDVRLEDETVWLTQAAMAELFQTTKQNISLHIKNILSESELNENSVVKEYLTTAGDDNIYKRLKKNNKKVIKSIDNCSSNCDIIISIPARPLRKHAQKWRVFNFMGVGV